MDNNYTWVKTHKGIVQYLSDKENSQQELIDLLKSVGITPFNDKSKEGEHDIELKEIDPFTFFCYIHKYGAKRALGFLKQIAELLGLEKPTTVNGIPSAQPQRVWLFPPEYMRVNNEVPRLWNLFKKELKGDVDNDTFADVLNIKNVGRAKLTEALFYINPEKYLPINGPTRPYIKKELGIDVGFTTYSEYIELLEKIRAKTDMPFYELSHEAWVWNIDKTKENYWVFQGNPDKYDFEAAFKEDDIDAWTVTSHKASIKEGDKVIIWITGDKAGCYALADVVSEPMDRESFADSDLWKEEDTSELKAAINITHNLASNPILKDEIDKIKDLDNLKVGSQGTNFSATKQEYETLLELAVKRNEEKRYWLYSPGEQAKDWEEFYNDGIMGLGWDKLDDLKSYKSKDEIKKALDKAYGGDGSKKNDTTANDEFANVMKVGDVVIVKKGFTELIGYGFVASDYIFDESREEYKHIRKMAWKLDGSWHIEEQMSPKTLTDITYSSNKDPNYDTYYESLLGIMKGENGTDMANKITHPLNTIFYGPPGTGKTYNTVNKALEIIDSEFLKENIDNREALNKRFRELRFNPETGEGQVAFITFHQSLSYEDFIEGIKPKKNEGDQEISYEVCDGLFKAIALKASDKKVVVLFDEIYKEFIGDVMEKETFSLNTPVQKKPFDVRINGSGNCVAIPQTETATQMVVTKKMIADFLVDGTVRDWKPYLSSIAEYIKANYSFKVDEEDNANKPYVIIIDEINRGNISQIFGELLEEELLLSASAIYMRNRHKLLLMARELHKSGCGYLRVAPSLSPSGMSWRCSFVDKLTKSEVEASIWLYGIEKEGENGLITIDAKEMADIFVRDNGEFVELCKGEDEEYTMWYAEMVARLEEDELPYAFAEYFSPSGFWKTSKGKEIASLAGDVKYYLNY